MIVKKHIAYLGIEKPSSPAQVKMEISGLKHAVKVAEEMIASLEQSLAIVNLRQEEITLNEKTQKEGTDSQADTKTKETA